MQSLLLNHIERPPVCQGLIFPQTYFFCPREIEKYRSEPQQAHVHATRLATTRKSPHAPAPSPYSPAWASNTPQTPSSHSQSPASHHYQLNCHIEIAGGIEENERMRGGGYERKGEERWEDKGNGGNWRDEPRGEEEVT